MTNASTLGDTGRSSARTGLALVQVQTSKCATGCAGWGADFRLRLGTRSALQSDGYGHPVDT